MLVASSKIELYILSSQCNVVILCDLLCYESAHASSKYYINKVFLISCYRKSTLILNVQVLLRWRIMVGLT